jgi:NtrC-family two-component system response regulator AlgB
MADLLIVDDDKNIRRTLSVLVESMGHKVDAAEDGAAALAILARKPVDLVLTDYRMGEVDGIEILKQARHRSPGLAVVLMTAYGTVDNAVAAMKAGACDYITKPFDPDQMRRVIDRALELQRLQVENRALREAVEEVPLLESSSPAMQRLLETAERAAASQATILLEGESGTGKNVLARQIHRWSQRRKRSFVVVNCTTLSEQLLESELFGHVKGAFTGAVKDKPGRLEAADGGTVFLDEIADLSPELQAKFLRFVQEQSFERVGGQGTVSVDTRIIAASNRDLGAEVSARRFREDLFYRLGVITLSLPSLRERREDVLPLADKLLAAAAVRGGRRPLALSDEAAAALLRYRWPGNIRELRNAVERAAVLCAGDVITSEYLPDSVFRPPPDVASTPWPAATLEQVEREHILRVLNESATLEDAAATLGINTSTLWRKRKRYQLE